MEVRKEEEEEEGEILVKVFNYSNFCGLNVHMYIFALKKLQATNFFEVFKIAALNKG